MSSIGEAGGSSASRQEKVARNQCLAKDGPGGLGGYVTRAGLRGSASSNDEQDARGFGPNEAKGETDFVHYWVFPGSFTASSPTSP